VSSSQDQTTEHAPSALHQVVSLWPPVPATQSESLDKVQDRQALVLQTLLVLESLSESGRGKISSKKDIVPESFLAQAVVHHEDRVATARSHLLTNPDERDMLERLRGNIIQQFKKVTEFLNVRSAKQAGKDLVNRVAWYMYNKTVMNRPSLETNFLNNAVEMLILEGLLGSGAPSAQSVVRPDSGKPTYSRVLPEGVTSSRPSVSKPPPPRYRLPLGFVRPDGALWCMTCVRKALRENKMSLADPPTAECWHARKDCPLMKQ
jgi:hypothetical protein